MAGKFISSFRERATCTSVVTSLILLLPIHAYADVIAPPTRFAHTAIVTDWSLPPSDRMFGFTPASNAGEERALGAIPEHPNTLAADQPLTSSTLRQRAGEKPNGRVLPARTNTSLEQKPRSKTPRDIKRLELAFQVFNAIDAGTTLVCLERSDCHEVNPVYGRHPKPIVVTGAKSMMAGLHYFVMRRTAPKHPNIAKVFGWFTVVVQGGVVGFNVTQLL